MSGQSPGLDRVEIAIDTGGTFTDAVGRRGDTVAVVKVLSTPDDPARAVATALSELRARLTIDPNDSPNVDLLIHGTTVATNALLEHAGAPVWLVTNRGFEDLLAIGRQARPHLYALQPTPSATLVAGDQVVGVGGRLEAGGRRIAPLDLGPLRDALDAAPPTAQTWAVCLLHGYHDGADERRVRDCILSARPDDDVSLSSEVLPVFREVERASTTVANAALRPIMGAYLAQLSGLARRVDIMGSSGGRLSLEVAREMPVHTALSGPAGGVVAAMAIARRRGLRGVLSFDMGGTSTDVALCGETLPLRHDASIGETPIHVPMLDIHTVGAGGGSIARLDLGGALRVGPQSVGADPGPACYGRGVTPTVTDANVVLGRLQSDARLAGTLPVDLERARAALASLATAMGTTTEQAAVGVIEIAVEKMAQAVRRISVERGVDPRTMPLCCFGGAGGLHACALADRLGIVEVIVPPHAGVLSAVGMLSSRPVVERSQTILGLDTASVLQTRDRAIADVLAQVDGAAVTKATLDLRYRGQSFELEVAFDDDLEAAIEAFAALHEARFGYRLNVGVEPVTVRVRAEADLPIAPLPDATPEFTGVVDGERVIARPDTTIFVPMGWSATAEADGTILLARSCSRDPAGANSPSGARSEVAGAIEVELFRHRFAAVAEEMGETLTLAAFSPNIKERRDHSCALFDARGDTVAQAAHIPVHLGAAPACVKAVCAALQLGDGETAIVNDPYAGGTHLPDITLVTAVDVGAHRFYVATRAHHADVGGIAAGSLPLSASIDDEGWRCPPTLLTDAVLEGLFRASRTPVERRGDIAAQRAANGLGCARLRALAETYGDDHVATMADALLAHSEAATRRWISSLPAGEVRVEDWLDDASGDGEAIAIRLALTVGVDGLVFDFTDTDDQVSGPMNAVRAIVESAVFYALLCCLGDDVSANGGVARPVEIRTRPGSVVDALPPSAVAAGNVETSQRLVDVIFAALRESMPSLIPAASVGSMNNVLIGSLPGAEAPWVIYETIGGGHGGGPAGAGGSAMQSHMTNTLNTPVEALEHAFPVRVVRYAVRRGSGGRGVAAGGDGIVREIAVDAPSELTLIAERRRRGPPGANGGADGAPGEDWIVRADGGRERIPGKASRVLQPGDSVVVQTPGGGGWGAPDPERDATVSAEKDPESGNLAPTEVS